MSMGSPRIAYATVARLGSGTAHEAYVVQLARAFAHCGCETTVAAPLFAGAEAELPRRFGVMPAKLNFQSLGRAAPAPGMASYLSAAVRLGTRAGSAGAGQALWITHHPLLAWAAVLRRQPWIFDVHQIDPRARLLLPALRRRSCRGILFNSDAARTKFQRLHGPLVVPAMVSRNAIDPAAFRVAPSQSDARRELGLPKGRWIFLYAGSFGSNRGLEQIIAAAAKFERNQPGRALWVLVGGQGATLAAMERRAREEGGGADIRLPGMQPLSRLPRWYAAADCLLAPYSARLPAADVMNPMKLYEYSAAGRPIVAADLPTVREALIGAGNVLLFTPDSLDALLDAFQTALARGPALLAAATAAREEALANTWEAKAASIIAWLGRIGAN